MIRLALLILSLTAGALQAQDYPALHHVTGVAADDVLNIRAAPDAGSAIIGTLAPDATGVEVVSASAGWAVVNTDEGTGYAALRFLERQPGPGWDALETPITCLGTEPFWSLALDPNARQSSLSSPDLAAPVKGSIGQIWPGAPWARTAAMELVDGLAVLRPDDCSDGMSDRSYGIAIDLFLRGGDRSRLSGCCTLALR